MLIFFYNVLQFIALILFWPLLLVLALATPKYRNRLPDRLSLGLSRKRITADINHPVFWLHALSVGEVTSALPLALGLKEKWPDSQIVMTVTTESGQATAKSLLGGHVDHIIAAPLDIRPVITNYLKHIRPDLYIHVETDFWPNLLTMLNAHDIPSVLVNGRISEQSLKSYQRYDFFFTPIFKSFSCLCMQTGQDKENQIRLGVDADKVYTLGNLKFDTPVNQRTESAGIEPYLAKEKFIIVAGSTHPGEEEIILEGYSRLLALSDNFYLVIAPRNIDRSDDIADLAQQHGLAVQLRSSPPSPGKQVLIVNTIGELVNFYSQGDVSFVGGSMVACGGHNPVEPALFGIPVLFGKHMEDFSEIADSLLQSEGAFSINSSDEFYNVIAGFYSDEDKKEQTGRAALNCVEMQQGVIKKHIDLISTLL